MIAELASWSGVLHALMVAAISAVAGILWKTSMTLERINTAQESHEQRDIDRFASVNQRIDDLMAEVRGR